MLSKAFPPFQWLVHLRAPAVQQGQASVGMQASSADSGLPEVFVSMTRGRVRAFILLSRGRRLQSESDEREGVMVIVIVIHHQSLDL